jgi:hypothetical protein
LFSIRHGRHLMAPLVWHLSECPFPTHGSDENGRADKITTNPDQLAGCNVRGRAESHDRLAVDLLSVAGQRGNPHSSGETLQTFSARCSWMLLTVAIAELPIMTQTAQNPKARIERMAVLVLTC